MASEVRPHLVFVYNADSGIRNTILDGAHKILSPKTYACHLCGITYRSITENKTWKKFRKEIGWKMEFLHKNEFLDKYGPETNASDTFPVVVRVTTKGLQEVIGTEKLNRLPDAEALIRMLKEVVDS